MFDWNFLLFLFNFLTHFQVVDLFAQLDFTSNVFQAGINFCLNLALNVSGSGIQFDLDQVQLLLVGVAQDLAGRGLRADILYVVLKLTQKFLNETKLCSKSV